MKIELHACYPPLPWEARPGKTPTPEGSDRIDLSARFEPADLVNMSRIARALNTREPTVLPGPDGPRLLREVAYLGEYALREVTLSREDEPEQVREQFRLAGEAGEWLLLHDVRASSPAVRQAIVEEAARRPEHPEARIFSAGPVLLKGFQLALV